MSDMTTDAAAAAPSLSLAHIQNAVRVIDFACEQGVFRGWATIVQVKELRDQLDAFAKSVEPPAEAATDAPAAAADTTASV